MKLADITATRLRIILAATLLLIEVIAILFVTNANQMLTSFAGEVRQVQANANSSRNNIETLRKIQQELLANKDAITRTSEIVADSQSYQYQDQILTDLNDYAKRAGITVTNLDFLDSGSSTSTPAPPTTTPSNTTPTPTGVKSTSVSVTIKNPVEYDKLLRFIKSIEQNLTKMQISSISLAKDTSGGVTSEVLTIEVYIR